MNRLKSILVAAIMVATSTFSLMAQTYQVDDLREFRNSSFNPIYNNEDLQGYVLFAKKDKIKGKNDLFSLLVLDADLKIKAKEEIEASDRTYYLESVYNGKFLMLKFYEYKLRKIKYIIIDGDGKVAAQKMRTANTYEVRTLTAQMQAESENSSLYVADDKGFIDMHGYKDKGYKYECTYIGNDGSFKWVYKPPTVKGVLVGSFLAQGDGKIFIMEGKSKNIMSRDYVYTLRAIDQNGKQLFNRDLTSGENRLTPHNVIEDPKTGDILMVGDYSSLSQKAAKAESQGVFITTINDEGMWVNEKFYSWERHINAKVDAKYRKEMDKFSVFVHDVMRTKDGNIVAIGEQYKKQVSAAGSALKMLSMASGGDGGEVSAAEMRIGNMVMITMDPSFKLTNVKVFEKRKSTALLPAGFAVVSTHLIAKYLKAMGYYDYLFRQYNEDRSVISMTYIDKEKVDGVKRRTNVVNFVNYVDEDKNYTTEKLPLTTEASRMGVYRAKPGYITVFEYFKKEKRLDLRLEPINF